MKANVKDFMIKVNATLRIWSAQVQMLQLFQ